MEGDPVSARRQLKTPGNLFARAGVWEILEKAGNGVGELSCCLGNESISLQDVLRGGAGC